MKIAIIGGGAAGLMAAATVAESHTDAQVVLFEKNIELGKKIIISGGGRCNVTTGLEDVKDVLKNYPRGSKFLTKVMYGFSPIAVRDFFESHNVPLKIEDDNRVFPISDDGHDIVAVFEDIFAEYAVDVRFKSSVKSITRKSKSFQIDGEQFDRVIITTGGQAYRGTGSTGDGYSLASSLGHTITPLAPGLSALNTSETWPAQVSGLSFQNIIISTPEIRSSKFEVRNSLGLMFTHFGITGPSVFALSSIIAYQTFSKTKPLPISIDLFPARRENDLHDNFRVLLSKYPKKDLVNVLASLIPKSFAEIVCNELNLKAHKNSADVSKTESQSMISWLKNIPLHITARVAGDEFITVGGVDLKEVDPSTMESKICPGLFFAGEILDVDGITGGFNLQNAWCTGRLAGESSLI